MSKPTLKRALELLEYDENSPSGLRWRISIRGVKDSAGKVAGCCVQRANGHYWQVRIDRDIFYAHQIVWLLATGNWPSSEIDHKDGLENKIANLRLATRQQQGANSRRNNKNTSGIKGVSWDKRKKKWRACIVVNGRQVFLGYFTSKEEAGTSYADAAKEYFGDFARIG